MRRAALWVATLFLFAGGLGVAHAQMAPDAAAASKAPATSKFLKPGELDASLIIPPPPEDGSPEASAELAALHSLAASRTPERLAQAQHDAAVEDVTAIAEIFGPALDLNQYPATARLFAEVHNEDGVAAKAAKKLFHRSRPWEVDAALAADPAQAACDKGAAKTSYPSGHAMTGYSAAGVLAQLMPGNAQIILARASDYAESRLICGVHFPSDVEASHVLATALVARLMANPDFKAEFEAARTELTAAHIAP
ncbi:MAG: phosphatase PAP2 family protein [Caulobacterales bacterium]